MGNSSNKEKCLQEGCRNSRNQEKGFFCVDHTCNSAGCNQEAIKRFCVYHECLIDGCICEKVDKRDYCNFHRKPSKCVNKKCSTMINRRILTVCQTHSCRKYEYSYSYNNGPLYSKKCDQAPRNKHTPYCIIHGCYANKCKNERAKSSSFYCQDHLCRIKDCRNQSLKNHNLCSEHKCGNSECSMKTSDGFPLCNIHFAEYSENLLVPNIKLLMDSECPICLDTLTKPVSVLNPCGHSFHQSCLIKYKSRRCAVCKQEIESTIKLYI